MADLPPERPTIPPRPSNTSPPQKVRKAPPPRKETQAPTAPSSSSGGTLGPKFPTPSDNSHVSMHLPDVSTGVEYSHIPTKDIQPVPAAKEDVNAVKETKGMKGLLNNFVNSVQGLRKRLC